MIHKFSCENYRNISVQDLELKRINLLIGPNNSGKTNFIKAITFYSNMLKYGASGTGGTDFYNAMQRVGWGHSLRNGAPAGTPISFEWDMDLDSEQITFRFSYVTGEKKEDFHIASEELYAPSDAKHERPFNYFKAHTTGVGNGLISTAVKKGDKGNKRLRFNLASNQSIFAQFKNILIENDKLLSEIAIRKNINNLMNRMDVALRSIYSYSSAQFDTQQIRKPTSGEASTGFLYRNGTNLIDLFQYYKNGALTWKIDFIDHMRDLMHDLQDIDVVSMFDQNMMRLVDGGDEFDLTDVSEGTIKALLLNFLINMPTSRRYSMIAIDEPENNLHPAWQKVVGNWVQASDNFEQCLISTHSPDFLDVFTEDFIDDRDVAIFVFSRDGHIRQISSSDIKAAIGNWELGDLYRTSDPLLGGWPW